MKKDTAIVVLLIMVVICAADRLFYLQDRIALKNECAAVIKESPDHGLQDELNSLRDENRMLSSRLLGELHKIYPGIMRLDDAKSGVNAVLLNAVDLQRNELTLVLENTGSAPIRPDVEVVFLSRYGVWCGSAFERWVMNTIRPGERRVETKRINLFDRPEFLVVRDQSK